MTSSSSKYGLGRDALGRHPLVARHRHPVTCSGQGDVEQPPLVGIAPFVAVGGEQLAWHKPVLALAGPRRREAVGGHRRHEHQRPLEALRPVHGGQVDGVELEVRLAVEVLVRTLGVVDDVDRQVAVVPVASVLTADLLAGHVGVGPRSPSHRLVVGEQLGEPGERPEPVHRHRVGEVPVANAELAEQIVELADEVGRAILPRHRGAPLPEESTQAVARRRVDVGTRARTRRAGQPPGPASLGRTLPATRRRSSRRTCARAPGPRVGRTGRCVRPAARGRRTSPTAGRAPDRRPDRGRARRCPGTARPASCASSTRAVTQPASRRLVGGGPGDHLAASARRPERRHRLRQAPRDRRGERVRRGDDRRAAAPVRRDLERRHVRVAVAERDDVGDVRPAPLVDRLVVVADDAQLDVRPGQQLDQSLLRRVDVLVLVDDEMPEVGVDGVDAARDARARPPPARSAARRSAAGTAPACRGS